MWEQQEGGKITNPATYAIFPLPHLCRVDSESDGFGFDLEVGVVSSI